MAAKKPGKTQQPSVARRPAITIHDDDEELDVSRVGRVIMRVPKRLSYEDALAVAARFKGPLERRQDPDQERSSR